jgi:cobyrinic acid a,c-diamide synthase
LVELYELTTRGADLSVLASAQGLLDTRKDQTWTPESVARLLDCPVVLVCDARGWAEGLAALVKGFNERVSDLNLAGLILVGVEDRSQRDLLRKAAGSSGVPVIGSLYLGGEVDWQTPPPGVTGLPLPEELLATVFAQVDLPALERIAAQRSFMPAGAGRTPATVDQGPLIAVAAGRGFTAWSRDSIEVLRLAGARVHRLDLSLDESLPEEAAGLVLAGHLWPETIADLAGNYSLMRDVRVKVSDGLPTLALGGGMLYLLRRLQDPFGRSYELAGVLPAEGELLGELDEPLYLELRAERDSVLLRAGEELRGWMVGDAEIMESPVSRSFPLSVRGAGWPEPRLEGAAAGTFFCSRVLIHLASRADMAGRFVAACSAYWGAA